MDQLGDVPAIDPGRAQPVRLGVLRREKQVPLGVGLAVTGEVDEDQIVPLDLLEHLFQPLEDRASGQILQGFGFGEFSVRRILQHFTQSLGVVQRAVQRMKPAILGVALVGDQDAVAIFGHATGPPNFREVSLPAARPSGISRP